MEHDLLATPDQLLSADSDADLIQVKEGSLLLRSPISRDYGDDSYPLPDPRAGYLLLFHVGLPIGLQRPQGIIPFRIINGIMKICQRYSTHR